MCGIKSRGNWNLGFCIKDCGNRDLKCGECVRFSEYKELPQESHKETPRASKGSNHGTESYLEILKDPESPRYRTEED